MKFGVAIFPTDYSISMTELAPAAEQLGFESLWVAEHSHIPTSRLSAWPGGQDLPKQYSHTLDPFVALTVAALASKTLLVATGICLVVQRDTIHTAKQVASLDQVSNGRFLFGVGAGWNREEMEDHGTDFSTRFQLMRERVEAMKAIWTEDAAEYHGKLVNFDPMWCWPKPVQRTERPETGRGLRGRMDAQPGRRPTANPRAAGACAGGRPRTSAGHCVPESRGGGHRAGGRCWSRKVHLVCATRRSRPGTVQARGAGRPDVAL
jgi:hypothetical protein